MDTGVDGSSQQAEGATSPRSHGTGESPSHSARTRTGRDGELQEAAIDLQMMTESEALLVEEALLKYFQGGEFREEAKMLSELASTRTFHCDGCGRNEENTMYSYDAGLETPTIDLCVECFDRGCPPEGSDRRPWDKALPWSTLDVRFPHVLHGGFVLDMEAAQASARQHVATAMESSLLRWGWTPEQDRADFLQKTMRDARAHKVRARLSHCVKLFGGGRDVEWSAASLDAASALEADIHAALTTEAFVARIDGVLADEEAGALAQRAEVAIAERESASCVAAGLAGGFDGLVQRAAVLEYVRELHGVDAPGAAAVLSVKLDVRQRVWAAALRSVRT